MVYAKIIGVINMGFDRLERLKHDSKDLLLDLDEMDVRTQYSHVYRCLRRAIGYDINKTYRVSYLAVLLDADNIVTRNAIITIRQKYKRDKLDRCDRHYDGDKPIPF